MSTYKPTPTQREFMLDDAYVRVLAGPVGGGKSVTCVHELVRMACEQAPNARGVRKTRAVIVRNNSSRGGTRAAEKVNIVQAANLKPLTAEQRTGQPLKAAAWRG